MQQRVREQRVLFTWLAVVVLVALIAFLVTLILFFWQLSAARPVAGELSKAVSSRIVSICFKNEYFSLS